jgi:hypothetical protein
MAGTPNRLIPIKSPALPLAPTDYVRQYIDQVNNISRIFYKQIDNLTNALLSNTGGRFFGIPYGSFYDTSTQNVASTTTAYVVSIASTQDNNSISLTTNQISFEFPGIYNVHFSVQLQNTVDTVQDVDIWLRKNGTDIDNSNNKFGLAPRKSVGEPFNLTATSDLLIEIPGEDYLELVWRSSNTGTGIVAYGANTSPTRPAIPSVSITVTFVSAIPA